MTSRPFTLLWLLIASAGAVARAAGSAAPPASRMPLGYLASMVADPKTTNATLGALRSTEDKALIPLLVAATRSEDKQRRLFGVISLGDLAGKDAAEVFLERLRTDPVMAVRAEALGQLIKYKAITPPQLGEALRVQDENVQCLAARALAEAGQAAAAIPTLELLAGAKDTSTAALSQACLLGLGRRDWEQGVRKVLRDPAVEPGILEAVLGQIERQKTTAALPAVLELGADEAAPMNLRVLAYKVAADISSLGGATLREAMAGSKNLALRVRLLKVLAARADAGPNLQRLVGGEDAVAVLARFELARQTGGPTADRSVLEAIAQEHPVVIAYVLDRAEEDIQAQGAKCDYYVPAMLQLIRGINPRPSRMEKEHFLAAGAATRLLELGTPRALAGLREVLGGKPTAITRAAAAGLLRAKNPAACDLARPLLGSPYGELSTDAALTIGHFGDPAAKPYLAEILAKSQQNAPALVILASWYLLKIDKQTDVAAQYLAKQIK